MRIDYVSDVSCPWCAVGLKGLEMALARTRDLIDATLVFQPFELNPDMPAGGVDNLEYVTRKYGLSAGQAAANRETIRARAAAVGFAMAALDRRRLYNTFDAHRLLHWAGLQGRQLALKLALLDAHFNDAADVSDHAVLAAIAVRAGLDGKGARDVLASGVHAEDVRRAEALWRARGIEAVPSVIIDGRYLISGGQPPEAFEQALRRIAAEAA
jgi:predicted DsbA family dithiol-disulfide isomerase